MVISQAEHLVCREKVDSTIDTPRGLMERAAIEIIVGKLDNALPCKTRTRKNSRFLALLQPMQVAVNIFMIMEGVTFTVSYS